MIVLENVNKFFGSFQALTNVNLTVDKGERVVVCGPSGSGKSTLLRCINRLVEPTSGRIFLDDEEVTGAGPGQLRKIRRKIGMIFQDYNLVERSPALTNALAGQLGYVSPWASLLNYFPRGETDRALEKIRQMDLGEKAFQKAGNLSGGQKQRVGIVRALMQDPKLILADEPVSSLDPATARNIMEILREINLQEGVTILCNLHLPELAREFGKRIIALKEGAIVYDGPPDESLDEAAFYS
ncbi:MAG: phosphonate ABC transporter ATP-binding protein [Nitrospinae bacterium]|nr:phosphonate ABC transporter ATP-binding protein [Nitrospinota bacterium]